MEKVDRLKIINKILKLLALSNNPNKQEGESALKKAKKLMAENNISEEEIQQILDNQNYRKEKPPKKEEEIITREQEINIEKCLRLLDRFKVGSFHTYDAGKEGDYELLIVKDIIYSPRENSFPFSPSYFKIKFYCSGAVSNETEMTVLFSQEIIKNIFPLINNEEKTKQNFLHNFQEELNRINNKRYIVTGNLLKALGEFNHAKYITYTTNDNQIKTGLLLSKRYKVKKIVYTPTDFLGLLKKDKKPITILSIKFQIIGNDLYVAVPRSKKLGGKFFTDRPLQDLTKDREGFISTSESVAFRAIFTGSNILQCLQRFENLGLNFEIIQEVKI